ncbi:hypothetical protein [Saccharibacillus kuerlensis]|uniref:Monooxygenase n=1 Tax=Saccharibacillus kuerlensis TaxID=459527 RepID=A0ABQ2KS58_9BACL|nr:hypothetical protein [Saccharibacillus kuerlensis]GGN91420.1 hypothetical protein GCM10010969_03070 [Saccharibacillus kuerlensis]
MNQRFRITRSMQENNTEPAISLEECQQYFASKPDFVYSNVWTVQGPESRMAIDGDFFIWKRGDLETPFRLYQGDLYAAVSDEAVVPKMIEIATDLQADITEG